MRTVAGYRWVPLSDGPLPITGSVDSCIEMRNLQAVLTCLWEIYPLRQGQIMAGAMLSAIPMFILFFSLQKYFFKGIPVGAVKG